MRKYTIIILLLLTFCLTGCMLGGRFEYDYKVLKKLSFDLKDVYTQLIELDKSSPGNDEWNETRLDIQEQLDEIGYFIDALPQAEYDSEQLDTQKAAKLNEKLSNAREIKQQLEDIYELLYSATVTSSSWYFGKIVNDPALEVRLDVLYERSKQNGKYIPLPAQYRNIAPSDYAEDIDVTIESENI